MYGWSDSIKIGNVVKQFQFELGRVEIDGNVESKNAIYASNIYICEYFLTFKHCTVVLFQVIIESMILFIYSTQFCVP